MNIYSYIMNKKSSQKDVCSAFGVHEDRIARAKKNLPNDSSVQDMAEFFKILGDPTRIRILSALSKEELCVCDLFVLLAMDQSAVSHQLKMLRLSRLVKARREGRMMYYSLADHHIEGIFKYGREHISEGPEPMAKDKKK
jgi:ArsR family transcriptional regulator, lead/cadmium/zinc/bismuth-responsive transcriptional repressor